MPKSRLLAFLIKELREVVPPTVFFAVGFNLILLRHTPSMSLGLEANFRVSQCPSAEVYSERTMHRKPTSRPESRSCPRASHRTNDLSRALRSPSQTSIADPLYIHSKAPGEAYFNFSPAPASVSFPLTPSKAYFTPPPEAAFSACAFCSSISSTFPTLQCSGRCLGGNSARLLSHCWTSAPAGSNMKRRSARHLL
jgi:hypothetical protein